MMRFAWIVLWVASAASASPTLNPYLSQARVFYQGLDFEKCIKRLGPAAHWDNSDAERAEVELYFGLCELGLNHEEDAQRHFEMALRTQRQVRPPPLSSPRVIDVFERARTRVPVAEAPAPIPSPPEKVVAQSADAPVHIALEPHQEIEPFGLERAPPSRPAPKLAIAVSSASALATAAAIFFGVQAKQFERQANQAEFESDALALGERARRAELTTNVCWISAGILGLAAGGLWMAHETL